MDDIYVFGYGSLLNPASRRKTFTERQTIEDVVLDGYQRKLNAVSDLFPDVAMNIVPNARTQVWGVVVAVSKADFPALLVRETGYEQIDVTNKVNIDLGVQIFTFIAPDHECNGKCAYQSYLNTCLKGVPETHREQWLRETIIPCEIIDDSDSVLYKEAA